MKNVPNLEVTKTVNSIKFASYMSETPQTSGISMRTINKTKYWDYEILWWGYRIYFHSNLVNDMKNWKSTTTGTGGIITGLLFRSWLIKVGMSTTPAGWISTVAGLAITWTFEKIINANKGRGVFIDGPWTPGSVMQLNICPA